MTAVNPGPASGGQRNSAAVLVRTNSEAPLPYAGAFSSFTGSINPLSADPRWFSIGTLPYSYFATAGTTNTMPLMWLPAGGMVHGIFLQPSPAMAGPSIASYTISIGISTSVALLASAYSMSTGGGTNFQLSDNFYAFNTGASTLITITAVSTGANLNKANQGGVIVRAFLSSLTGT